MEEVIIMRPARPGDNHQAALLIYSTGPESFKVVFGSRNRAILILEKLFIKTGTISSFEYGTVAELHNRVAGILMLHDHEDAQRTQTRTGLELLRLVGPLFILFRLPLYLRQRSSNPSPESRELFVADVAVAPEFQGRGIGKLLMMEAESRARLKGYNTISLGVRKDNHPAVGLYRKLGYVCEEVKADPWLKRRFGLPGVYRMVKTLKT